MALGTTGISITAVQTELGLTPSSTMTLNELCTHANINPWARYKPGYLESDGTADKFVFHQVPQGGAFTDPRGFNSDSQSSLEGYRLGDFRGYNHSAISPYVDFPAGTIEYASGTGTATGISRTFHAGEINWANPATVYRETANWVDMTNVHLLDADDDSIAGTAALPAIGGTVSIPITGITLVPGSVVTKTYHVAFGLDATHWSIKLGTLNGAGGIGTVSVKELSARAITEAQFDDVSFAGGTNDPYSAVYISDGIGGAGGTTNYFTGVDVATWEFDDIPSFLCNYTHSGGGANSVDVSGAPGGCPTTFTDGDLISLIFRNLSIVF